MNRTLTIGLFAGIFAIAVGAISLSGDSASTFMVSADPKSQESMGLLGHVEYIVRDDADQIKSYAQTDNIVTQNGKDCVATRMFGDGSSTVGGCLSATSFSQIAIGNRTVATPDGTEIQLDFDGTNGCALGGTNEGELARKTAVVTYDLTDQDNPKVILDTSTDPFTFTGVNATTTNKILQSGLFNTGGTYTSDALGQCTDTDETAIDMFAIQELNGVNGIDVTAGDSLSVKWTITVGST